MTHICVSKLTTIGSDNGLSPGRRQAIIQCCLIFNWTWGTNFNEILIDIHTFSLKKIYLKMSFGKWRPFCLGLNVLNMCCKCYQCLTGWPSWAVLAVNIVASHSHYCQEIETSPKIYTKVLAKCDKSFSTSWRVFTIFVKDNSLEDTTNVFSAWRRHQMATFSALLALCEENPPVNFPHKDQCRGASIFSLIWTHADNSF